ncbi:hypothetical protein HZA26_02275 [Candidatus Nomurabacteria bacterium]|nr:hypothetical protein [Candidatus Nomurabacteria bacterium]
MKKRKAVFKLTNDEQKFESEIERGEWKAIPKHESNRIHQEMAAASRNKDARVNLRLNPEDVSKIRDKAAREGIPYQTLIASILHKYATDQFLDEKAVRTAVHQIGSKKF